MLSLHFALSNCALSIPHLNPNAPSLDKRQGNIWKLCSCRETNVCCLQSRGPRIYNTIRCISIMNLNFVTKYWSVVSILCIGEDLAVQASRSLLFHSEIMWDVKTFWLDLSKVVFFYPSALSVLGNNSCNWLCLHVFQGIDRLSV